jgi:hypothetical protein
VAVPDSSARVTGDTAGEYEEEVLMEIWLYGWDWGWVVLLLVWAVVLAAALFAVAHFTNGPPSQPR